MQFLLRTDSAVSGQYQQHNSGIGLWFWPDYPGGGDGGISWAANITVGPAAQEINLDGCIGVFDCMIIDTGVSVLAWMWLVSDPTQSSLAWRDGILSETNPKDRLAFQCRESIFGDHEISLHHVRVTGADCNGNAIADHLDIASGVEADCNSNLIPDSCDIATGVPTCSNQALQLNGSSYIRVPDNASLDLTGPFTIECWVKSDNPTKPLVMKWGDDGINDRSYSVTFMPDQKFQFGVARSDNQLDQNFAPFLIAPFNTTQWRHVACVYDGIQRLTYVDGVLQATKLTSGQVHIGTTDLAIGAHLRNNGIPVTESLTGLIDEVRIWNVARSEGQIRSTINKRLTPGVVGGYSGLVSCWNFEGNANDAKGTNNGNPVGAPTYVLASDQPVLFDCNGNGVYDGEEVGSNPALDLNNNGILDACECTLSSVCQTSPNSAGTGALMSYAGNSSLSGSLTLLATGCPTNVSGFFFYGTQPALVPLGNGWRCIGGTIARLPVVNTGATGVGARTLNYAQLPPNGPITAGSTKYFQFYYRDVQGGGSGFNLSNSLKVLFCP
jgi:hypothetical protein